MSAARYSLIPLLAFLISACSAPTPETPGATASEPTMAACADSVEPPDSPVYAFFHCAGAELEPPQPVSRPAQAADPVIRLEAAVRGLLGGPTPQERDAGYISLFSEQTALALNSVELGADGVAIVDFADLRVAIPNASTSTGSQILLAQLGATVFQIPEVAAVEYRIHGSCDTFWEWLQRACEVVPRP
jgi:spore germination protein GerM